MWIKVTRLDDVDVLVNADKIEAIYPFDAKDGRGCNLYFNTGEVPLKTKTTIDQLDTLLDVNSIEKCIDRLKVENTRLKRQMQFDKMLNELCDTNAKNGNEDVE